MSIKEAIRSSEKVIAVIKNKSGRKKTIQLGFWSRLINLYRRIIK